MMYCARVNRQGVSYDVGRVLGINWRPAFDPQIVRGELTAIRDDLHCNTVRICGRDLERLSAAGRIALDLGLEVWLSPELWNKSQQAAVSYLGQAAKVAETLRQASPGGVVLSVASEATLFTRGIVPGRTLMQRLAYLFREFDTGKHVTPLRAFLHDAVSAARSGFTGPLTYASLVFEDVDWTLFDFVGVDHYRDARVKDRYAEMLKPHFTTGKPVVVTEFGMRTYRDADTSGALGFGVTDPRSLVLHRLPVLGRFIRPHLKKGDHVRDEAGQAREIVETLAILDAANVDGAFVCTFVEPLSTFDEDPHYDLDMSSLALVKTLGHGTSTTYPNMPWEPKASFHAVAEFYAARNANQQSPPGGQIE
jgi:hypothetical protein